MTAEPGERPVHVLVVDDSALVRDMLQRLLRRYGAMVVSVAADPLIAMRKIERSRPDVILLDLAMPRMDGLSFLRKIMAEDPIPVVVFSALTSATTDAVFRALEDGAIDVVTKPRVGMSEFLAESLTVLVDALQGAAGAKVARRRPAPGPRLTADAVLAPPSSPRTAPDPSSCVIALGASTGGTEALAVVLGALPAETPAIAVVQHMPETFTGAFARRLDATCAMRVREARDGDPLERGCVLVAPGNRHLVLRRAGEGYVAQLLEAPLVSRHRPSVDVLFRSVADVVGAAAIGVILTGMGADGADGMLEMSRRGAVTIAQDEASCVVFGMPKEAIARGGVGHVMSLSNIAPALLRQAHRTNGRERISPREGMR